MYPFSGIFDFAMAAKASNIIAPAGTEHCASCDTVSLKTRLEQRDRSMSSSQCFDVRDVRFCRIQERTVAITDTLLAALYGSAPPLKAALLLNGISRSIGTSFHFLMDARDPGIFNMHEPVIAAPSHLLY